MAPKAGGGGGTGGKSDGGVTPLPDGGGTDAPGPANAPRVVISEIMYHPVMEAEVEEHEFVEIANRSNAAVALGGWKLSGGVTFTFPAGTMLAPGAHLVVAKNPQKLGALAKYAIASGSLQGPFMGELNNGGELVAIADASGQVVDSVRYDDRAPWPIAADALGAGEAWLKGENLPLTKHQFMGRSLERVSYEIPAQEPANWAPSPLDGATPGKANANAGKLEAIAETVGHISASEASVAKPMEEVMVRVRFSARGTVTSPQVEWFVDDVERTDEMRTLVPLVRAGDLWEAKLPGQPARSIVRYRVLDGTRPITPRPSDPNEHHAYWVTPGVTGATPTYELFIKKTDWARLYTFLGSSRVQGCNLNPTWNNRVPAIFVSDKGQVVDVMARYQGSPYNRWGGPAIKTWPAGAWPTQPTDKKALSWRLYIPRYAPIDGKRALILNKRSNECGGLRTGIGGGLFESAGIPSAKVTFARLYLNGTYYHYMSEIEHPDEDMLKRYFGKDHPVGDFFKVVGYNGEQGPYGWSDARQLAANPACPAYTPAQRYDYNYDRKAPEWKGTAAQEVKELVDKLHAAKAAGTLRQFFMDEFDYALTLNYIAVINWLGPWDDFFQNHFLYRRGDTKKWMFVPWDFDLMFGDYVPANGSFYVGELNDRNNRVVDTIKWNNFMKDAFIKTFRTELHDKLRELAADKLSLAAVNKQIEVMTPLYKQQEALTSATGAACDPAGFFNKVRSYTTARNARITSGVFN